MWPLILKTVGKNKIRLLIFILICVLFVWMFVSFFPSVFDQAEEFEKILSNYPEAFAKAFGLEQGNIFQSLESFLAVEYGSLIWPTMLIILMITFASGALAGEIEEGTIELLLSQPISRTKIFLAKYISGIILIFLFVLLTNLSVIPFAQLYDVEVELSNILIFSVLGFLFAVSIFSLTIMLSSIFSNRSQPTFITAGIIIIMYVVYILSTLKESAENLKYLSFFYYFDYQKALVEGQIDLLSILVFLAVTLFCTLIGWLCFLKRNIST